MTMPESSAGTTTSEDSLTSRDTLFNVLNGIQDHIRFADSKAGMIAAALVILFGFMATNSDGLRGVSEAERDAFFWVRMSLFLTYGTCTVVGFVYAVRCVIPRTGDFVPACLFHVATVAKTYGKDHDRYCADVIATDATGWTKQIASQIVENSHSAHEKFRLVKWAARWTVAAVVVWATMLMASSVSRVAASSSDAASTNAASTGSPGTTLPSALAE